MNPQTFVNVSGIDQNEGASVVFVWCRHQEADEHPLLGVGYVVGAAPGSRPPGVLAGQFCVTLPLPAGATVDQVYVTDDVRGRERLRGVMVSACGTRSGSLPHAAPSSGLERQDIPYALNSASINGRG